MSLTTVRGSVKPLLPTHGTLLIANRGVVQCFGVCFTVLRNLLVSQGRLNINKGSGVERDRAGIRHVCLAFGKHATLSSPVAVRRRISNSKTTTRPSLSNGTPPAADPSGPSAFPFSSNTGRCCVVLLLLLCVCVRLVVGQRSGGGGGGGGGAQHGAAGWGSGPGPPTQPDRSCTSTRPTLGVARKQPSYSVLHLG
jgi:hypothetical protein